MAVLVTGGGGFLGAALLPRLAAQQEVLAMHRPGADTPTIENVSWIEQDLSAPLSSALPDSIDGVFHLAQSRRYREFPDGALDVFEVNSAATVRLLDYCRRAGGSTFAYASSGAVYASGPEPVRESDTPAPGNFYGTSKLAGEQAVEQFRGVLKAHSLRFFFIYGPGQRNMFIPGVLGRVRDGQDVTLAGPDGIRVNPVYVDDAADAVIATLALEESFTLNVAGPDVVSVKEIAELGGRLQSAEPSFAVGDPQADLVASTDLQSATVGAPTTSFEEGLRRTVEAG
ncbi:MAG TPA: NAD(P)-dependent oxidoreductase [Solirubrobacteraceae bacterium]|jgi:nucleoside-diphosphate-sugar epimerase